MTEQLREMMEEAGVDDRTRSLIEAATRDRGLLDSVIDGAALEPSTQASADEEDASVFVSSIGVQGFRGIGDKSTLLLTPGPGWTSL